MHSRRERDGLIEDLSGHGRVCDLRHIPVTILRIRAASGSGRAPFGRRRNHWKPARTGAWDGQTHYWHASCI